MMPMFPLGSVLLPGALLPLHVFEPRYRQLVQDCLEDSDHEFGVVLIERGHEVGGGDVRSNVGTVARMLQVAEMTDGRYALVTIGTRRIRVNAWVPDDPYPLADVDDWPDDEDVDTDGLDHRLEQMAARVRRVNAIAAEAGAANIDTEWKLTADALVDSYRLSAAAPLGPADQQRLLRARGPAERVALLADALDDVEAILQFRLSAGTDE